MGVNALTDLSRSRQRVLIIARILIARIPRGG
jgi:hypothetical protein